MSLDGAYGVRRSDKYDGVPEDRILCVTTTTTTTTVLRLCGICPGKPG